MELPPDFFKIKKFTIIQSSDTVFSGCFRLDSSAFKIFVSKTIYGIYHLLVFDKSILMKILKINL